MSPFAQTVISVILGGVFGGSGVSLVTFLIQRHDKKTDKRDEEFKALQDSIDALRMEINKISEAVRGLGNDRLSHLCGKYIRRKGVTQGEYNTLEKYLFDPYKALGGDGGVDKLMDEVRELPTITNAEADRRDGLKKQEVAG